MANSGALDLTSHLGGKIQKDDVLDAVDKYFYIHSFLCLLYLYE